jgi:hypothetical protein
VFRAVFAGLICVVWMTIQVTTMSIDEVGLSLAYFIFRQYLQLIARPRLFSIIKDVITIIINELVVRIVSQGLITFP